MFNVINGLKRKKMKSFWLFLLYSQQIRFESLVLQFKYMEHDGLILEKHLFW